MEVYKMKKVNTLTAILAYFALQSVIHLVCSKSTGGSFFF